MIEILHRARLLSLSLKEKLSCLFLCCLLALPDLLSITQNMENSCLKFSGSGVTVSRKQHYFTRVLFSLIYGALLSLIYRARKEIEGKAAELPAEAKFHLLWAFAGRPWILLLSCPVSLGESLLISKEPRARDCFQVSDIRI